MHRISGVNTVTRYGTCELCGVVYLYTKKNTNGSTVYVCSESKKQYWKTHKAGVPTHCGLDREERDEYIAHYGKCAICSSTKALLVDHDHTTKVVRGVLCKNCNFGLGHFFDSIPNLEAAIKYLQY